MNAPGKISGGNAGLGPRRSLHFRLRGAAGLAALAAAAAVLAGCRPSADRERPTPPQSWDWAAYPESAELLIAEVPVTVQPVRREIIRAPASGLWRLEPGAAPGGIVREGALWARIAPDGADEEKRELEDIQRTLDERRGRYRRLELPLELDQLDRGIAEAEETVAIARLAERSPTLFSGDPPPLDPSLRPPFSAERAQAHLGLLRERRVRTAADEPDTEPPEIQALRTEVERRRRQHETREREMVLAAPFTGRLELIHADPGGATRVGAGEPIAVIEDDSVLEVRVRTQALFQQTPPESLRAVIGLPGGASAAATYAGPDIEFEGEYPRRVLRFRLPDAARDPRGRPPLGVEIPALIYARLPEPARVVPKLVLARYDTAGVLSEGWRTGMQSLFPGCRLLAEGRQSVAVEPPGR